MASALNRHVPDVSAYQDARGSGLIPRHPLGPKTRAARCVVKHQE